MPRKKKEPTEELKIDLELFTKSGKLRKRKRKKTIDYFTKETEDAIVCYNNSSDINERNYLFNTKINNSIHKLVENIINTFKFYYMEVDTIEELKHEVVVFLLDKLYLYDQSKGKAYSYFGTIAKRYLIVYNNTNYKRLKDRVELDHVDEDRKVLANINDEERGAQLSIFIDKYIKYIKQNIDIKFQDPREKEIVNAVMEIFKRRENLDVFNKQVFYLYIKELTNQPTPIITKVIKSLKSIYKDLLNEEYHTGDIYSENNDIY